jgi:predicted HTH domain antitoxin
MTRKNYTFLRYAHDVLSEAEQIIDAALETGRFTWDDVWPLGNQLTKHLNLPKNQAQDLVRMVHQRKRTLAVLAVFTGARTLKEAATEARISQSELVELLRSRKRTLEDVFGPEGHKLRRASGLPGRIPNDAIEQLDVALLSRNPKTIAQEIKSLLSGRGNQEHRSETVSVEKLHDVMEWLVRELSGATSNEKDIAAYRALTAGDRSQSAQTPPPQARPRRKNTP